MQHQLRVWGPGQPAGAEAGLGRRGSTRRPAWNSACEDLRIRTHRFPEGACLGMRMEPAPSHACSVEPCPSRAPGPAPAAAEHGAEKGWGAMPPARGASRGEQRGRGLRGGSAGSAQPGVQPADSAPQPGAELALGCCSWAQGAGADLRLASRPRGWGSAGVCPSAAREVVAGGQSVCLWGCRVDLC